MSDRHTVGRRGEALVADWLERRSFSIVGRNVRVGRLELDLIARRARLLVFCEVRSLSSDRLYAPAESIDGRKIARLRQAAARWLADQRIRGVDVRFDVAAVVFDGPSGEGRIEYYENAF